MEIVAFTDTQTNIHPFVLFKCHMVSTTPLFLQGTCRLNNPQMGITDAQPPFKNPANIPIMDQHNDIIIRQIILVMGCSQSILWLVYRCCMHKNNMVDFYCAKMDGVMASCTGCERKAGSLWQDVSYSAEVTTYLYNEYS